MLSIKVEVAPGTSIEEACAEAIRLADQFHAPVSFDFNNVPMVARHGGIVREMVEEYNRLLPVFNKKREWRSSE